MNYFKSISIGAHGALEMLAAPLLIVAPFVLGFGYLAGAISIGLGVALIGLAGSIYGGEGERPSVPLAAHAGLDQALGIFTVFIGVILLITGELAPGTFMVGFGAAHLALYASTRYSRPLGA
ncbi:MAG: hypothetical protein K0S15_1731 [Solirubrobacterales bacterium]|jgi:hypothetical protein|nr:hypothetical protein [Solirubrobacterales bacterium]